MQTATNGSSAHEMLESLRIAIERLETELAETRKENVQLRTDRDEYRQMLVDQIKPQLSSPEDWANARPEDYTILDGPLSDLRTQ